MQGSLYNSAEQLMQITHSDSASEHHPDQTIFRSSSHKEFSEIWNYRATDPFFNK